MSRKGYNSNRKVAAMALRSHRHPRTVRLVLLPTVVQNAGPWRPRLCPMCPRGVCIPPRASTLKNDPKTPKRSCAEKKPGLLRATHPLFDMRPCLATTSGTRSPRLASLSSQAPLLDGLCLSATTQRDSKCAQQIACLSRKMRYPNVLRRKWLQQLCHHGSLSLGRQT